jgi:hypothetical protein
MSRHRANVTLEPLHRVGLAAEPIAAASGG